MPMTTASDQAQLFYKDWGDGPPVVFLHGWPLTADVWDPQLKLVADAGFRGIATDRRGHGRSTQTWAGNDMDTYADDLDALMTELDLTDAVLVGHSTGGGVAARYVGRHGTSRLKKVVLRGAVTPHLLGTDSSPWGAPMSVFDDLRGGVTSDRSAFYQGLALPFYGANRDGAAVSQGLLDAFWLMSMSVGTSAAYDCVAAFSVSDFSDDLRAMDLPVLVSHGDDDQIVPFHASAPEAMKLLPNAELSVHPGAPHGLVGQFEQAFNAELLAFVSS